MLNLFEKEMSAMNDMPAKADEDRRSELTDLLSEKMSPEEFKKQFFGEFKQDPMLQEAVEFLRTATFKQIADARKLGLLTVEMHREAKRILNMQSR